MSQWVLIGGSGFIGRKVCVSLLRSGNEVVVIDKCHPGHEHKRLRWLQADILIDELDLPPGRVVLMAGCACPRPRRLWTLPFLNAIGTARLAHRLRGRDVVLLSSVEVYGWARGPLRETTSPELPVSESELLDWCERALSLAEGTCYASVAVHLCNELQAQDTTGRWVYALSKRAQELIVQTSADADALIILRLGNVFGQGQERYISRVLRRASSGQIVSVPANTVRSFVPVEYVSQAVQIELPSGTYNVAGEPRDLNTVASLLGQGIGLALDVRSVEAAKRDSCGWIDGSKLAQHCPWRCSIDDELIDFAKKFSPTSPIFVKPIEIVSPPRPEIPDALHKRLDHTLSSGELKFGNRWTSELEERLRAFLSIADDRRLLLTNSGTAALRLCADALIMGRRHRSRQRRAILPSFTFAATAEFLVQMNYELVYCDVDSKTWNMDPSHLRVLLGQYEPDLTVGVDALGNPMDYAAIAELCDEANVQFLADSAASLTAKHQGLPLGTQADAHAFSMSFAKVVTSGGAGGFAVVPAGINLFRGANWLRSSMMNELNAAVTLDQFDRLDVIMAHRAMVAAKYHEFIGGLVGLERQEPYRGNVHSYTHWGMRVRHPYDRDIVAERLESLGIRTRRYYYPLAHEVLHMAVPASMLTESRRLAKEVLSLPMSSEMTIDEVENVVTGVGVAIAEKLWTGLPLVSQGDHFN
ncbi:MAG: DegT/DnrJ/EryC1/StrS family aminotransferase [Pseudonocardiales bacterium]|nr:DegT/DnrJ/EryC1/StrS family aminotransferase [Pseudonocardiales bacterium]